MLYEMLTGRRAFPGHDLSDTIAGILRGDADWTALPVSTPSSIRKLLRGCLDKDRRERLPDIGVARLEIKGTLSAPLTEAIGLLPVPRRRVWQRPVLLIAAPLALLGAAALGFWSLTRPAPARVTRLMLTSSGATALGTGGSPRHLAISPDGTRVAYVGAAGRQIFVRAFDQLEPTAALEGVDAEDGLFFSPDGQWIGFFDRGSVLKKVVVSGGPPLTISRTIGNPLGASWSVDDTIIFATYAPASGLLRVPAAGGEPEVLTTPNRDAGEHDHLRPEVLPGGQAVLFTIVTGATAHIAVLDLTTREQRILIRGGSHRRYVPTGHLVYAVEGTMRAGRSASTSDGTRSWARQCRCWNR